MDLFGTSAYQVSVYHWHREILAAAGRRRWRSLGDLKLRTGFARRHLERHVGELVAAGELETRARRGRVLRYRGKGT